jgi:hypothetical protein
VEKEEIIYKESSPTFLILEKIYNQCGDENRA